MTLEKNDYPKASSKCESVHTTPFILDLMLCVIPILFSDFLVFGGLLTYIAGLFLLIAFARQTYTFYTRTPIDILHSIIFCFSPYWVQSYEETFSNFKNMGLWEYCFYQFHYPYNQFYQLFNGCHYIFSHVNIYIIQLMQDSILIFFFVGILHYPRMVATWMVNGSSNICDFSLYFKFYFSSNYCNAIMQMASRVRLTVRVDFICD